ncbi:sulfite reductase flavoprotein subunit alpha [Flavobacterium sp. RHBU_3]|uniref:diflavin oxidoreductase n=1 Tax=Flavobacterium sp. RHBU_3 TaxID=3391184 RepID=UPI0039848549
MLPDSKLAILKELVKVSSPEELIWSKGYIAGFLEGRNSIGTPVADTAIIPVQVKPVIVYGTETGNAKKVASGLLASFKKKKINARTVDIFGLDPKKLEKESHVLFIISTQGEGEFPLSAQAFYEQLTTKDYNLKELSYSVFGLGDSSYPLFNQAAIALDEALEKHGAKRLLPLVKADVNYAETVSQWENDLQTAFAGVSVATTTVVTSPSVSNTHTKEIHKGILSHKVILNDTGSNKETYHLEISTNEEVQYAPGDALGVIARNSTAKIVPILNWLKLEGSTDITIGNESKSATNWLAEKNILGLSKRSVKNIGKLLHIDFRDEVTDLEDLLSQAALPEEFKAAALLKELLPVAPRLYSISSSPEAHDGEVHLTVNLNTFKANGTEKQGLASTYLTVFEADETFDFYIHPNPNFRLPEDDRDIIMIGPGTGIAPFRSFIAHRDATGADGKNWLFFGEQHFVLDFYYQTEIQDWLASGVLTNLDVAFSRDQQHKIYVQDRIREKAAEFNQWLQNGAVLYICGQKSPMSTDVERAIIEVIAEQRNISLTDAANVLEQLETEGRYKKDVY